MENFIEAMSPDGNAVLDRFREEHLHPKVIAWYRRSPQFERLWTKPAGYAGDYATSELLCRGTAGTCTSTTSS